MLKVKEEETAEEFRKEFEKAAGHNGELFKNVVPETAPSAKEDESSSNKNSPPVPVVDDFFELYGADAATEAATRYDNIEKAFQEAYNDAPSFFVHAPGRANIIGEHIDYHMYSVLPFALSQDVVIAVSVGDGNEVEVRNLESSFEPGRFPADSKSSVDTSGGLNWYQYVQAGYLGYYKENKDKSPKALKMMVHGTVPPAGGVSSSSALVVAAVLATAYSHEDTLTKQQLGNLAQKSENDVGMMGGGMDQAISSMGELGKAARIDFIPSLSSTPVPLPEDVRFIIANSMVKSAKAVDAAQKYNRRVAEGKLAAKLVAKKEGKDNWKTIQHVHELQKTFMLKKPEELELFLKHLEEASYSKEELEKEFDCSLDDLFADDPHKDKVKQVFDCVKSDEKAFALLQRLRHIVKEAQRVLDFEATARKGGESCLQRLGELMDASHASCRDDYECSIDELDELVTIAKDNGAVGARLTGAGWGGCIIAMTTESKYKDIVEALKETFYKARGVADTSNVLFVSAPARGAAVYKESEDSFDI